MGKSEGPSNRILTEKTEYEDVGKLVTPPDFQSGHRGFDPRHPYYTSVYRFGGRNWLTQWSPKPQDAGSNPVRSAMKTEWIDTSPVSPKRDRKGYRLFIDEKDTGVFVMLYSSPYSDNWYIAEEVEGMAYDSIYVPPPARSMSFATSEEAKKYVAQFHPKAHEYIEHPTYTGPGCATCGKPEKGHYAKNT